MFFYNKKTKQDKTIYYMDTIFENGEFKDLNRKVINLDDPNFFDNLNDHFKGVQFLDESHFKNVEIIEICISINGISWYRRHIEIEKLTMDFLLKNFHLLDIDSLLPKLKAKNIFSSQNINTLELIKEMI